MTPIQSSKTLGSNSTALKSDKSKRIIRVLVFGATGIGKTSLCNTLTGRFRPTDNGARGVTTKSHIYPPLRTEDYEIQIVDTAGLHESSSGTVPAEKAVVALVELLENAKDGFSLLVHVTRASRITKEHDDDYKFFVDKMTQNRIPVILTVTGCENEQPMSSWVDKNKNAFSHFAYKDIVPGCFASGGPLENFYAPLRMQSRDHLLKSILQNADSEPIKLYGAGTGSSFTEALGRIWNEFVTIAGLPDKYRRKVNETAYSLMKRLGVPQTIADAAVKHLPDLFEELGNKTPVPFAGKVLRKMSEFLIKLTSQASKNENS